MLLGSYGYLRLLAPMCYFLGLLVCLRGTGTVARPLLQASLLFLALWEVFIALARPLDAWLLRTLDRMGVAVFMILLALQVAGSLIALLFYLSELAKYYE